MDQIAEEVAMGLSGPSPSFAKLGAFLAKQALKGIKDNVQHYCTFPIQITVNFEW